mmetsp:Transcript_81270/g.122122  ORF Transcript_81270/g.122122 Transcript_81270/m.122122 type:complete len:345 (-) Transcript_81270:69-1103(-)
MAAPKPSKRTIEREIAQIERELKEVSDESAKDSVEVIRVDGLVLLKIIKHCKQNIPEIVTGQLLGLAKNGILEVTNCFPRLDDDDEPRSSTNYQIEMMKALREVNVDTNTVGWYRSAYLGSVFNESMIESQLAYQSKIEKSVVLVYDPLQSATLGVLALKAYRLSEPFMAEFSGKTFDSKSLDKSNFSLPDLFVEVPVEVYNSYLASSYLWDIESDKSLKNISLNGLDLSGSHFLEKNLDVAIEYLDELSAEQAKSQNYQRALYKQQAQLQKRKSENASRKLAGESELSEDDLAKAGPPPSRLDFMVTTNQINNHCQQINQLAGQNLTKSYLFNALANPSQSLE